MHEASCMLTLTYDDINLPKYGQLVKRDLQLFFKRLRRGNPAFRYVACGEYGDRSRRPHFHVCLFGIDFVSDRVPVGKSKSGDTRYTSPSLEKVWGLGMVDIGALNFESAAYVARYVMKKIKGPGASPAPLALDFVTGEVILPNSEFLLASKGHGKGRGIGGTWFRDFFMSDVYPHASVVTSQGSKAPVPRYYKSLLKEVGTDLAFDMSARTLTKVYETASLAELSPERRSTRETVTMSRLSLSKRS